MYLNFNLEEIGPGLLANSSWEIKSKILQNDILDLSKFTKLLSLDCSRMRLKGIKNIPSGLIELNCEYNFLTTLPTLPSSLELLNCENNSLKELPSLPHGLEVLKCMKNSLSELPVLPNTIRYIDCNFNRLSHLPSLPNSVTVLNCQNNKLTSLPKLSNNLILLTCENNKLESLPLLPSRLEKLLCENNHLESIPSLPNSLKYLNIDKNHITVLPYNLPNSLVRLYGRNNPFIMPLYVKNIPANIVTDLQLTLMEPKVTNQELQDMAKESLISIPLKPPSLRKLSMMSLLHKGTTADLMKARKIPYLIPDDRRLVELDDNSHGGKKHIKRYKNMSRKKRSIKRKTRKNRNLK
jgi:Leucine-rich repeat (LRR) protein